MLRFRIRLYRTRVTDTAAVELCPIDDGQVDQVAEFLHRELQPSCHRRGLG